MKFYLVSIAIIFLCLDIQGMPSVNIGEELKKISVEFTRLTEEESTIKTEFELSILQRHFNILKD